MRNQFKLQSITLAALFTIFACAFIDSNVPAQSSAADKAKQEKFGSSLKRLKWDSKKGAAVESRKKEKRSEDAIKLETLLVTFDVLVTDKATGRPVTGLGKDDFIVIEEGRAQQIATLVPGNDTSLPRSVVLIIDRSQSQSIYLDASVKAAKMLVSQLGPADEMAIVTDDVELLVAYTRDKNHLSAALDSINWQASPEQRRLPSRSFQFSALFATFRELIRSEGRRAIIIFQTDGDEATTLRDQKDAFGFARSLPVGLDRKYGLADIFASAEKSSATVYTVIPSDRLIGVAPGELYARGRKMLSKWWGRPQSASDEEYHKYPGAQPLTEAEVKVWTDLFKRGQEAAVTVAELSGGWAAFLERPEQAADVYARILSDINQRYVIGYYPANTERDGRMRRVRIDVRGHPEYSVHGRSSYYAPAAK